MSKPVNATAIGGFILGGLFLLASALLVFGSGDLFKPKLNWVVFFDSSLNGLNVGAPVKVQGVQIGIVKTIGLEVDKEKNLWKPVELEIEPSRLTDPGGNPITLSMSHEERRHMFKRLLDQGMRARLEMQSLLTGLLYVDLDFEKNGSQLRRSGLNYRGLPEVPSVPPTVDEFKDSLESIAIMIQKMPIESMVADLATTLSEIREMVASEETRQSRIALTRALQTLDQQLPRLIESLEKSLDSLGEASREVGLVAQGLNRESGAVMKATEKALESAELAADNLAEATNADSDFLRTMTELRTTSQSIRDLAEYLERHPDSILFGKAE